jgi:drug/metabolite transporter (DMT)-like permease
MILLMNNKVKGSAALFVARVFSGLNVNAMSFLLPVWIAPIGCVTVRLVFGAIVFWVVSIFSKPENVAWSDKLKLMALGAFGIFGYMSLYALSISYTTPVNFAIFNAMQPLWVVVVSALLYHESIEGRKLTGLAIGFAGALLCILSEPAAGTATDARLGNILAILSSIIYSVYLVLSARFVGHLASVVILRYTFTAAAVVALIVSSFVGFDAPLFKEAHYTPLLVLLYVLVFPTVVTYFLIPVGMKYLDSAVVALYGYVTLIVATGVSLLLGMDKFDPMVIFSLLLIGVSIYWVGVSDKKRV